MEETGLELRSSEPSSGPLSPIASQGKISGLGTGQDEVVFPAQLEVMLVTSLWL